MNAITAIFNSNVGAQVIDVTPELAAKILETHNYSNRQIKTKLVAKYARLMTMGDWKFTPETICVSTTGRLLQGQHRMLAVIKSQVTCRFLFATGFSDDVFDALDRGATRTVADALGINKGLAEVARLLASVSLKSKSPTDADIRRACQVLEEPYQNLIDHCGTARRVFSSAPMRLAAISRVMGGADRDYVYGLYRSLVLGNTANLPPIGHAVIGSFLSGKLDAAILSGGHGGGRQTKLLTMGWTIYDPEQRDRKRTYTVFNETLIAQLIKATGYEA